MNGALGFGPCGAVHRTQASVQPTRVLAMCVTTAPARLSTTSLYVGEVFSNGSKSVRGASAAPRPTDRACRAAAGHVAVGPAAAGTRGTAPASGRVPRQTDPSCFLSRRATELL